MRSKMTLYLSLMSPRVLLTSSSSRNRSASAPSSPAHPWSNAESLSPASSSPVPPSESRGVGESSARGEPRSSASISYAESATTGSRGVGGVGPRDAPRDAPAPGAAVVAESPARRSMSRRLRAEGGGGGGRGMGSRRQRRRRRRAFGGGAGARGGARGGAVPKRRDAPSIAPRLDAPPPHRHPAQERRAERNHPEHDRGAPGVRHAGPQRNPAPRRPAARRPLGEKEGGGGRVGLNFASRLSFSRADVVARVFESPAEVVVGTLEIRARAIARAAPVARAPWARSSSGRRPTRCSRAGRPCDGATSGCVDRPQSSDEPPPPRPGRSVLGRFELFALVSSSVVIL
jgi:hypothetical protein